MNTLAIALGAITILYFISALLKKFIERIFGLPVCAICIAVASTWIGLFIARLIGYPVADIVLASLMGGSVVGVMYKLEKIFEEKKLTNYWIVRIGIVLFGFTAVYMLIAGEFRYLFLTGILAVFFAASCAFFVKKENGQEKSKNGFLEKMKNCC